jgi:anti-sigma B factor antagonist
MKDNRLQVEALDAPGGDTRILRCSGPLINSTLSTLQDLIRAEAARRIIVDMTEVPYIDSAGLGELIRAHVSLLNSGRALSLAGINNRVREVLALTHVLAIFSIFPTAADVK